MAVAVKNDRVGESLEYLEDARIGETLHFYYTGGSSEGYRTVRVQKVDSDVVEGACKERNGDYRRFKHEDASSITVVAPFLLPGESALPVKVNAGELRVRFDEAGEKLISSLPASVLAELYGKYVAVEGEGVTYDEQRGEVVVKLPEPPKLELTAVKDHQGAFLKATLGKKLFRIHTYTGGGETLGVHFDNGEYRGNDSFDSRHATLEDLHTQLGKFLGK